MKCTKCEICKYSDIQSSPVGSDNPKIYVVGESLNIEEKSSGNIFTGKAGKFFKDMLDGFGLNENSVRFNNLIRCFPQVSETDESYRKPTNEEIENCYEYLIDDIVKTNPNIIITLGSTVSKKFIGDEFTTITKCHGMIFERKLDRNNSDSSFGFSIMPVYHPSYILRQYGNSKLRLDLKQDIMKCIDFCSGNISYDNTDDRSDYDDNTDLCLTYKDFDNFCKSECDEVSIVSYDIETNAEEKTSERFEVVGFSLSSRSNKGCYVVLRSLDYVMSDLDKKLVQARLRKILLSKSKVYTYNCMHELPATLNWLGIDFSNNVEDLFVIVKLLMGNAGRYEGNGGLKIQAQMNLNTKDWSKDLDLYFQYLTEFNKSEDSMRGLISKYYNSNEIQEIMNMIESVYNDPETFKNKVISYGLVPYRLIGKYGGTDSSILFDLLDFYQNEMKKYNDELGIDLFTGYRYWMNHHIAGYTLERNGAYWNEKVACEVEDWCNTGMKESLQNLVVSSLSEPFIRSKLDYDFKLYLKDNYIEQILGNYAVPIRKYKNSVNISLNQTYYNKLNEILDNMSLSPNNKG